MIRLLQQIKMLVMIISILTFLHTKDLNTIINPHLIIKIFLV